MRTIENQIINIFKDNNIITNKDLLKIFYERNLSELECQNSMRKLIESEIIEKSDLNGNIIYKLIKTIDDLINFLK